MLQTLIFLQVGRDLPDLGVGMSVTSTSGSILEQLKGKIFKVEATGVGLAVCVCVCESQSGLGRDRLG